MRGASFTISSMMPPTGVASTTTSLPLAGLDRIGEANINARAPLCAGKLCLRVAANDLAAKPGALTASPNEPPISPVPMIVICRMDMKN